MPSYSRVGKHRNPAGSGTVLDQLKVSRGRNLLRSSGSALPARRKRACSIVSCASLDHFCNHFRSAGERSIRAQRFSTWPTSPRTLPIRARVNPGAVGIQTRGPSDSTRSTGRRAELVVLYGKAEAVIQQEKASLTLLVGVLTGRKREEGSEWSIVEIRTSRLNISKASPTEAKTSQ